MSIDWFYSDPHFGHANILKHTARPFDDVDEMNLELTHRYENRVGASDMVLWCGDCSWDMALLRDVLSQLPGRKGLVIGNHDRSARQMARAGFDFVVREMDIDLDGVPCLVSHYPPLKYSPEDARYPERRPSPPKDVVTIHGHTHDRYAIKQPEKRVHVGVDAWDFAPVSRGDVTRLAHAVVSGRPSGGRSGPPRPARRRGGAR